MDAILSVSSEKEVPQQLDLPKASFTNVATTGQLLQVLPLKNTPSNSTDTKMDTVTTSSLETVCQSVESGGLGIPFLRAKCDSLLLKKMLRMVVDNYSHQSRYGHQN